MKKPRRPRPVLDLPSPEEVNAAAAELSDAPAPVKKQSAPKKKTVTAKKKTIAEPPIPTTVVSSSVPSAEVKAVGRPRANHGRRSTSVMVKPAIWKKLKLLALQRDVDLSEMLEELFLDFLKKK